MSRSHTVIKLAVLKGRIDSLETLISKRWNPDYVSEVALRYAVMKRNIGLIHEIVAKLGVTFKGVEASVPVARNTGDMVIIDYLNRLKITDEMLPTNKHPLATTRAPTKHIEVGKRLIGSKQQNKEV